MTGCSAVHDPAATRVRAPGRDARYPSATTWSYAATTVARATARSAAAGGHSGCPVSASLLRGLPTRPRLVANTGGSYNEHLVRDVGVLFLALVVATAWTAWTRRGDRALAVAWIVQSGAHLAFHAAHLAHFAAADRAGLLASLVVVVVLAIAACCWPSDGSTGVAA